MQDLEGEIWKDVPGFEGLYQVSNMQRCRSLDRLTLCIRKGTQYSAFFKGKILKPGKVPDGYVTYLFRDKGIIKIWVLHRLMMIAFSIPNPENKLEINHINGIKTDNRFENLEWVTKSENIRHAIRIGLKNTPKGEKSCQSKISDIDFANISIRKSKGETLKQIAESLNVTVGHIRDILNGKPLRCNNLTT